MGLLGDSWEDPRTMAALQMGAGLLAAGGPSRTPMNLGMGLSAGLDQYQSSMAQSARQRALEEELGIRKMDAEQRRIEFQKRADDERAAREQTQAALQWIDQNRPDLAPLARMNLPEAVKRAFPGAQAPLVTKPGDVLRDPNDPSKVLAQNAPDPDKDPEFVRMMRAAGIPEGSPMWVSQLQQYLRTKSSHAPAATQNVFTGTMVPAERNGQQVFVMPTKTGEAQVVEGLVPPGTAKAAEAADARKSAALNQAKLVINKVDSALGLVGTTTTGLLGSQYGKIPGSPAYNLRKEIDTIKSNIGFSTLQAMREASPTGGALGQVAVQELDMLQASLSSLDPNQSADQLKNNLDTVKRHFNNVVGILNGKMPSGNSGTGGSSVSGTIAPQIGEVRGGYRFRGGNPADPNAWEQAR